MKFKFMWIMSLALIFMSCGQETPEMTLEQIAEYTKRSGELLLSKTQYKPLDSKKHEPGIVGGTWNATTLSDPKTFNQYIGERDGESAGLISQTLDYLVDYDSVTKSWIPRAAYFEIETDSKKGTLTVHYTLRENQCWSWYNQEKTVPVTSDDYVFWYNEIAGNKEFQCSAYNSQFVTMEDGSQAHIDCIKIDDRRFDFVFPRIVADPLLATNMESCPSFIYKKALEEDGIDGVKNLFNASSDPKLLPSMGKWYISEYTPAQRLVLKRNKFFWDKDEKGISIPYPEEKIIQIVGNQSTDYLLFNQGKQEIYLPRPEELDAVVNNQNDKYTVFRADGSNSAQMWSFNQNPKNKDSAYYKWFTKKEFRQAMSCLLNRSRIINQTYRGLAEPKYDFFPSANPFYNSDITLKYRFNSQQAVSLLEKIGIRQDSQGIMRDADGNKIEFDLTITSSASVTNDIAQIISDECAKVGITVNIRQTDFQKMVEMLTATYDWQTIIIGLGSNLFPSQGSNVWPSKGNLHLWHPNQETPATDWEKRIDFLYNEGSYTNDKNEAKKIWDEYQTILLEQCPVIYLVRSKSFVAIQNRWNLSNFYFDNINGAVTDYIWLEEK